MQQVPKTRFEAQFLAALQIILVALQVTELKSDYPATIQRTDSAGLTVPLAAFDLTDLAPVTAAYLSAGQRRRLGLTRLLSAHRPIWLLDEPTVSLDEDSRNRFAALVKSHLASGGIVIAATHVDLGLPAAKQLHLATSRKAAA